MKSRNFFKKIQLAIVNLHLADKCLLIFMIILLAQSAHNLFFNTIDSQNGDKLDIIVRTTAAAIFGYFISANFQNGNKNNVDSEENITIETMAQFNAHIKKIQEIDFVGQSKKEKSGFESADKFCENGKKCRNQLQILVVSIIGLFSLLTLLIFHNYVGTSLESVATISQLRDFVSGSVGFLIGHTTQEKK